MDRRYKSMNIYWMCLMTVVYIHTAEAVESAHGCTNDNIQLTCSLDKTISVTDADYAQYGEVCTGCCDPDAASDCSEAVAVVEPSAWQNILDTCNNQTTCEIQNFGHELDDCLSPYFSDYMIIYYRCLPEDPTTTPDTTESPSTEPESTPAPRPSTTTPPDDEGGGAPVAAIIGGVVAAVLLVVLIILLVFLIIRLRKKPLPKKKVRIVKRSSSAQRQNNQQGLNNQPASSNSQPSRNQSASPASNEPIPPYVAYENKGYDTDDVEIVMETKNSSKSKQNGDHKRMSASNGLAGTADIKGNVPTTSQSKNTFDNLINENKAQHANAKTRPVSSQNNQHIPERPKKPPVPRASKPQTENRNTVHRSNSKYNDFPKSRRDMKPSVEKDLTSEQRHRSIAASSEGSTKTDNLKQVDVEPEAPPLEQKTIPPDFYENFEPKK